MNLYHASPVLLKVLKPFVSDIGINYAASEGWDKKAVYAAEEMLQVIPFGLERINMMWPGSHTEKEVRSWKSLCWLDRNKKKQLLQMAYYNYTPNKPIYIYVLDSKDFIKIKDPRGAFVKQWYTTKTVKPLDKKKLYPVQVKESWYKASKQVWKDKFQSYIDNGKFK